MAYVHNKFHICPNTIASCFGSRRKKREEPHSMVESVVSFIVERLGNLLIEEAAFLQGVSQQVNQI